MKKLLLFLLLNLPTTLWLHAQSDTYEKISGRFNNYRQQALTEKIYAHLDRTSYVTGETMWFKLYTVDGTFHKPLDLSRVAYVEIIDNSGQSLLQAKVELKAGLGHGSLFIPASIETGSYVFRVYTNWMKNSPADYFHRQVISLINPFVAPPPSRRDAQVCTVDFFPEGGQLVAGISSRIGFAVTSSQGSPGFCGGVIEDDGGAVVAIFRPGPSGNGNFIMKPEAGMKYRAVITDATGRRHIAKFPEVQRYGYAMQVRESGDDVVIAVRTQGITEKGMFLFAHSRNIVARAEALSLVADSALFIIPKQDLQSGVNHFTLFNESLQPVCERLFFKEPSAKLALDIQASHRSIGQRKKMTVTVNTKTSEQLPSEAYLSMAVFHIDSLQTNTSAGIHSYLWMQSDLALPATTRISPSHKQTQETATEIDNLMLTRGWRRFDWNKVLTEEPVFRFLPEVRQHIVTAVVRKEGVPQRSVLTYLGSPGKIVRAYGVWTNPEGLARFEIKDFYGPRRIILQAGKDSLDRYELEVVSPFSPAKESYSPPPLIITKNMKESLERRSVAMQVQDIYYYQEFGERVESPNIDSTAFYGKADNTYFLDDYTRFPLMEEVMREYVPGVFVRKRKDGFHFIMVDHVNGGVFDGDPMVLLDGVPVPDVDNIMRVDPLRVKKLEVVKRPYYLGQATFSGVVSYSTYNGDLGGLQLNPAAISLDYEGLQLKRIFHKPEYTRDGAANRMPDQRMLLHWQPDIVTNEDGKSQLEFFTSDVPGNYLVVVEGITASGLSGSAQYLFTVPPEDTD